MKPLANAKAILTFFYERSGRQPSVQSGAIGEVLRQISKYHHPQPAEMQAAIRKWAIRVAKKHGGRMTAKNRSRLGALTETRTRANLMHLPRHLMGLAEDPTASLAYRSQQAMAAAAHELLQICPMRLKNLRLVRIDRHLRTDVRTGLVTHLSIPGTETKNGEPIEWPVPADTAALLGAYRKKYRPHLGPEESPFLFPGTKGGARSESAIRGCIAKAAMRHLGVKLNPHLMRAFAAWSYLRDNPGDYETIRRVLGHRDIKTTIRFYVDLEAEFAARKFDATVLRARRRTSAMASAAFRKRRPSRRR